MQGLLSAIRLCGSKYSQNRIKKVAKIELEPQIKVVYNHGLKEQTLKKAVSTCENYRDEFIAEWFRRFDD